MMITDRHSETFPDSNSDHRAATTFGNKSANTSHINSNPHIDIISLTGITTIINMNTDIHDTNDVKTRVIVNIDTFREWRSRTRSWNRLQERRKRTRTQKRDTDTDTNTHVNTNTDKLNITTNTNRSQYFYSCRAILNVCFDLRIGIIHGISISIWSNMRVKTLSLVVETYNLLMRYEFDSKLLLYSNKNYI